MFRAVRLEKCFLASCFQNQSPPFYSVMGSGIDGMETMTGSRQTRPIVPEIAHSISHMNSHVTKSISRENLKVYILFR